MKINWKLRFQNKITLTAIVLAVISLVYQFLGIAGYVPAISQETIIQLAGAVINLLVLLGIVVDPTTSGMEDSDQAMDYDEPRGK